MRTRQVECGQGREGAPRWIHNFRWWWLLDASERALAKEVKQLRLHVVSESSSSNPINV